MPKSPAEIFTQSTGPRRLRAIYEKHVSSGVARGRDGLDPAALREGIGDTCARLSRRLRNGTHRYTQYRQLLSSRGAGKTPRVISIPSARDRIALKALAELLLEVFPETRPSLPQTRVEQVRRVWESDTFDTYVKIDVKDFYPSVTHEQIERRLRTKIRKRLVIESLLVPLRVPTVPDGGTRRPVSAAPSCGVPQGLAISNLLAELVIQPVDRVMHADARCAYFRYVDDILILCDEADAEELKGRVSRSLLQVGLMCHDASAGASKSALAPVVDGFDYLGYVFSAERVSVRRSSVRNLESALARHFTRYRREHTGGRDARADAFALQRCLWYVNLTITGCIYDGVSKGWLQYFRQMDDLTLLKELDATLAVFKKRFGLTRQKTKQFMRAYWAIKHQSLTAKSYVPNFDKFTIADMRDHLSLVDDDATHVSDALVRVRFRRLLSRAVADLERDVGFTS